VDIGTETYTAGIDLTANEFYAKIAAPGVLTGTSTLRSANAASLRRDRA